MKEIIPILILISTLTSFSKEHFFQYQNSQLDTFVLEETLSQSWRDSLWKNNRNWIYTYDTHARNTTVIVQLWGSVDWLNYQKTAYFYENNSKKVIRTLFYGWNSSGWYAGQENINTYDSTGKLIKVEIGWSDRDMYYYYQNGNLKTIIDQQLNTNDDMWYDTNRDTFSYDQNNNLIEEVKQTWKNQMWFNGSRNIYLYNSNGYKTEATWQFWSQDSTWENNSKEIYTYDSVGNVTEFLFQFWSNEKWKNIDKTIYTYDSNNNLYESFGYSISNDTCKLVSKRTYTYKKLSVPIKNTFKNHLINSFILRLVPKGIYLKTSHAKTSNLVLTIFNIQGREIASFNNSQPFKDGFLFTWDKLIFSNNAYVFVVMDGSGLVVGKKKIVFMR